ncbi:tRNA pseudouridine(13) synthase TruD [Halovenus salina]|uniref:Probable tRNA pseudouridine synthase D n=1 Tax=Halovenus salina TaxID=1510225 RepID=A0ABD5W5S3_9EURY|nr:tRNA pseudouridine(13) synthase TruD [Halovenus salina]
MREAHPLEREVGIGYYVSDADGTGGQLRQEPADFRVREREDFAAEPVDADTDAYPHLLLRVTLRNWDTNDFARALSNRLGISRERVSWAGTKDKRAVTTQLFSIDGIAADAVPDLDDVSYEVVGRTGRPILFGDLAGNEFEVTVRETDGHEHARASLRELTEFGGQRDDDSPVVGVPNYFGQQRFGSKRPVTHEVGLGLLRGDWERAVMAYVGNPSEREPEPTRDARSFAEQSRDWQAALDEFPRQLTHERAMLHRLVKGDDSPADFREALEAVPTNLQRLFVHAAQSYAFNRMLSLRLERGLPFDRPVAGDVVCFTDSDAPEGVTVPDTGRTQRVDESRLDSVTRHCERGRAFVTAPLVGTETELADGEPGDIEREMLEEVGIEPTDFDLPGEFNSTGTRRAVLVQTTLDLAFDPLELSFALPRGSYATVVLREFMKCDPERL